MPDQNFHEVQLSGKQLFFLFMCAVVLAAVIFIFGVSVGRGVRPASTQNAQTDAPGDTTVPADAPPAVAPAANPNELSYAQALEGRGPDPATVTPPAPPAEEPASAAADRSTAAPARPAKPDAPAKTDAAPPKTVPAVPKADASPTTAAPAAKADPKAAPATGGFIVQVEAFGSNDVASREVAKLQRQGHPAKVFTAPEGTPGPRFKVQVGPFATRAEADKTVKALRTEGYKPLIKR